MEVFDVKVLRKMFRMSSRLKAHYDQTSKALRAERVANPPGPGNLRDLKAKADKDALQQTYETLSSDPSFAEDARQYDRLFAKQHGAAAVRARG